MALSILTPENMETKADMYYIEFLLKNTDYTEILRLQILNCKFKAQFPYDEKLVKAFLLLGYVVNTRSKIQDESTNTYEKINPAEIEDKYIIIDWFTIYQTNSVRLNKYRQLHIHSHQSHMNTLRNIMSEVVNTITEAANKGEYTCVYDCDNEKIRLFIQSKLLAAKYKVTTVKNSILISWGVSVL